MTASNYRFNRISALIVGALFMVSGFAVKATPLESGVWTQVGNMSAGGGMFNGNCNLASSGCSYDDGSDFWTAFPEVFSDQEILFITGDRQIWGVAEYSAVAEIISESAVDFFPNITWTDAGLNGASIGSVTGNILQRSGAVEDPWITLRGGHCAHTISAAFPEANDCNLIIWGENNWEGWDGAVHTSLKNASWGVEVYVSRSVPEPATLVLLALGLVGIGTRASRRVVS